MTNKDWMKFKKQLPANWAQVVSDNITTTGTAITAKQVCQVRSGDIASLVLQEKVWKEIKSVHQLEAKKIARVKALQQIVK